MGVVFGCQSLERHLLQYGKVYSSKLDSLYFVVKIIDSGI